ncbi:hypothetical protein [Egibacter rhizosphaerae]|nr:hypothetical protein [Egibacter rhizosphaerae]
MEHVLARDPNAPRLAILDVRGTPANALWYATTLDTSRAPPLAAELQRFLATPEATRVLLSARSGVPARRAPTTPHVTLWSGPSPRR